MYVQPYTRYFGKLGPIIPNQTGSE